MDVSNMGHLALQGYGLLIALGIKVLEALALWIVGRWLIGFSVNMIGRAMTRQKIDPTLILYINNTVPAILNIVLVIAILGFFGVETTSFAALIAAAGVAIGMAWSGLLGNFAAGVFIIILQPFKVGDFVLAAGVMGTVEEVGLFVTSINTLDNIRNIVGNGKILGDVVERIHALKVKTVLVRAGRAVRKYKAVKSDGPNDLVFQSVKDGKAMRDNNILSRFIKPAARKVGLGFVNWRCLRTSYGTWLKRHGADMKDIQGQMRHSRMSTTADIYVQDIPESRRRAVERLPLPTTVQ